MLAATLAAPRTLSSAMGLPIKMTTRCRWFLFCRCLSASCAICTAVARLMSPSIRISCIAFSTLPRSGVGVTSTCAGGQGRERARELGGGTPANQQGAAHPRQARATASHARHGRSLGTDCREQHLWRLPGHGHHADRVLWVVLRLGARQQVHGVGLRLESRGRIVAVARVLTVVHAHHGGLLQGPGGKETIGKGKRAAGLGGVRLVGGRWWPRLAFWSAAPRHGFACDSARRQGRRRDERRCRGDADRPEAEDRCPGRSGSSPLPLDCHKEILVRSSAPNSGLREGPRAVRSPWLFPSVALGVVGQWNAIAGTGDRQEQAMCFAEGPSRAGGTGCAFLPCLCSAILLVRDPPISGPPGGDRRTDGRRDAVQHPVDCGDQRGASPSDQGKDDRVRAPDCAWMASPAWLLGRPPLPRAFAACALLHGCHDRCTQRPQC